MSGTQSVTPKVYIRGWAWGWLVTSNSAARSSSPDTRHTAKVKGPGSGFMPRGPRQTSYFPWHPDPAARSPSPDTATEQGTMSMVEGPPGQMFTPGVRGRCPTFLYTWLGLRMVSNDCHVQFLLPSAHHPTHGRRPSHNKQCPECRVPRSLPGYSRVWARGWPASTPRPDVAARSSSPSTQPQPN